MGDKTVEKTKKVIPKKTLEETSKLVKVKTIALPFIIAITGVIFTGWCAAEIFTNYLGEFNFFSVLFSRLGINTNDNSWHIMAIVIVGAISLLAFLTISIPMWVSDNKKIQGGFIVISWLLPIIYLVIAIYYVIQNTAILFSSEDIVPPLVMLGFIICSFVWLIFNIFATVELATKKTIIQKSSKSIRAEKIAKKEKLEKNVTEKIEADKLRKHMDRLNDKLSEINKTKFFGTQTMRNILSEKEIEELNLSKDLTSDFTRDYTADLRSEVTSSPEPENSDVVATYKKNEASQHEEEREAEKTVILNQGETTEDTVIFKNSEVSAKPDYLNPQLQTRPSRENLINDSRFQILEDENLRPEYEAIKTEEPVYENQKDLNSELEKEETRYTFEADLTNEGIAKPIYNHDSRKSESTNEQIYENTDENTLVTIRLDQKTISESLENEQLITIPIPSPIKETEEIADSEDKQMKLKRFFKRKENKEELLIDPVEEMDYDDKTVKFRRSERNNAKRLSEEYEAEHIEEGMALTPEQIGSDYVENDEEYEKDSVHFEDQSRPIKPEIQQPMKENNFSYVREEEVDNEYLRKPELRNNVQIQSMKEIKKEPVFVSEREKRKQELESLKESIRDNIIIPDNLEGKMSRDNIASKMNFYNNLSETSSNPRTPKSNNESLNDRVFIGDYDRIWKKTQQDPARKKVISGLYGENNETKGPVMNPAIDDFQRKAKSSKPKENIYHRVSTDIKAKTKQKSLAKQTSKKVSVPKKPITIKKKTVKKPKKPIATSSNKFYNDNKFYANDVRSESVVPRSELRNAGKFFFEDED